MARFPSLPDHAGVPDILRRFPAGVRALLEYHDAILRGASPLTVAERELIAAYVSGLNTCGYCHGAHRMIAEVHGIPPETFEGLMEDPAAAGLAQRLVPIMDYVRKLTLAPSRLTDADAAAVYAAGWDEQALFDAISVCALFNFMNRLVEGCGVKLDAKVNEDMRERMSSTRGLHSYRELGRALGLD